VLDEAAAAPSLQKHLDGIGWMNPLYGQLRNALADNWGRSSTLSVQQIRLLQLNLDRAVRSRRTRDAATSSSTRTPPGSGCMKMAVFATR
jgi:hypothetical protein